MRKRFYQCVNRMELRQVRFLLETPEIRDAAISLSQELISFIVFRFARPYERIRGKRVGKPSANILISYGVLCPSGPTKIIQYQPVMVDFA